MYCYIHKVEGVHLPHHYSRKIKTKNIPTPLKDAIRFALGSFFDIYKNYNASNPLSYAITQQMKHISKLLHGFKEIAKQLVRVGVSNIMYLGLDFFQFSQQLRCGKSTLICSC